MRIGVAMAEQISSSIDQLEDAVRQAAEDGMSSVWLTDPVYGVDAATAIAAAARSVPQIEVGTAVAPVYFSHPVTMARQAITADLATGGRFTLGLGLSHQLIVEGMLHLPYEKPASYMREYLAVLNPLLTDGKVSYKGREFSADVQLLARPTRPVPVLLAAMAPRMLALAGSQAAGTVLWMTGPKTISEHIVPRISEAAESAQRPSPRVLCILPVCVTDDPQRVRRRTAELLALYNTLPAYKAVLDREGVTGPADVAIIGDAEEVRGRIQALAPLGVTDFIAGEIAEDPDESARTRALLSDLADGALTPHARSSRA